MNNLYENLRNSVYVLHGLDGEFLADLAEPIPFIPSRRWSPRGNLAVIPSNRIKSLRLAARIAQFRIKRHRAHFAALLREGRVSDCGEDLGMSTSEAYGYLVSLQEDYKSQHEALTRA